MPDTTESGPTSTTTRTDQIAVSKRTDGGRPKRMSDDEILTAVTAALASTGDPVVTTSEIVEQDGVTISHRGLSKRLRQLHDEGHLRSKKVGARGRVWWVPTKK